VLVSFYGCEGLLFSVVEGELAAGFVIVQAGNVEPEGGLENTADGSFLEFEDDVFELLDHLAFWEPAEVAAFAGTIGVLVGDLREGFSFFQTPERIAGFRFLVGEYLALVRVENDVGGFVLIGNAKFGLILFVVGERGFLRGFGDSCVELLQGNACRRRSRA